MKISNLIIHCLLIFTATIAPSMSTSLIIPCCAGHAKHLYELLTIYEKQTTLPDEVIISLSDFHKVNSLIIKKLQNRSWQFPVLLLASNKQAFAGANRNKACSYAKGDIFICQDADDFPHPQRIEIIKYFFEKYHLDHLAHQFLLQNSSESINEDHHKIKDFKIYNNLEAVPFQFINSWRQSHDKLGIANGVVALSKKVFNTIKWSNKKAGEDIEFNQKIYRTFKNILVVCTPLYIYRQFLSSNKKETFSNSNFIKQLIHNEKKTNNPNKYTIQITTIL